MLIWLNNFFLIPVLNYLIYSFMLLRVLLKLLLKYKEPCVNLDAQYEVHGCPYPQWIEKIFNSPDLSIHGFCSNCALYISCKRTGENKTQSNLARASGVTDVTIRNRFHHLKFVLDVELD
jgi:hypothetical protein